MVISKSILDISAEKSKLLYHLAVKKSAGKVSPANQGIDSNLSIDNIHVILDAIEWKLRKCQMLYYTFFEGIDHSVLSGSGLLISGKIIEAEFSYGTQVIKSKLEINDMPSYKELIDSNFQVFILIHSSLLENIVRLTEIVLKKIIIHSARNPPLSAPYSMLVEYWDHLVALQYKKRDDFYNCTQRYNPFFNKYLKILSALRNRAIHGYTNYLTTDGTFYRITNQLDQQGFPASTNMELVVDNFTKKVLDETIAFTKELLEIMIKKAKHHKQLIPM